MGRLFYLLTKLNFQVMKVIARKMGTTHIMYVNASSKYEAVERALSMHGQDYMEFECQNFVRKSYYHRQIDMDFLMKHDRLLLQHITTDHRGDFVCNIEIKDNVMHRYELFNGLPIGRPQKSKKDNEDLLYLANYYILLGFKVVKGEIKGEGR